MFAEPHGAGDWTFLTGAASALPVPPNVRLHYNEMFIKPSEEGLLFSLH